MTKKSVRPLRAQAERRAELLDLKGPIVYYVPEGGEGFEKSVVFQNFTSPPPPPKKLLHIKIVPPLEIKIFKMHPLPHSTPSSQSLFFHPWALTS